MASTFSTEFGILFAASLAGATCVLPYGLRLLRSSGSRQPPTMSFHVMLLLSSLQTAILFAVVVCLGLLAAHAIRLGAPYIEAALGGTGSPVPVERMLKVAMPLGAAMGVLLFMADLLFLPYWPEALLDFARKASPLESFLASFYGGLNEEFLMRLFGLSVLAWSLSFIWHTPTGFPTTGVFWIANTIMAILFAMGHLPALKSLLGQIPPLMHARTLLLNAPVGLVCGWLYWTHGIEAAVVAHFCVDVVYHVGGSAILCGKFAR
jgi:Type II CAAX prenyl endopeptidase Rce1-like